MYRFIRSKILQRFLERQITNRRLAEMAGISQQTAFRAVNGLPIQATGVAGIAKALGIDKVDEWLLKPQEAHNGQ